MTEPAPARVVVAVDPGTGKCGLAAARSDGAVLRQAVVPAGEAAGLATEWAAEFGAVAIVFGDGTGSRAVRQALRRLSAAAALPLEAVDERGSSEEARRLYLRAHPPKGWARLVPPFLRFPAESYDDHCAVVVARRWFALGRADGMATNPDNPSAAARLP
ncbi:MAG: pre-16S rRNA-processing nuclease YqgF [Armatimonadetes bacterium]|nr:pre-16S rRNA-processing nuclease YqgF [Armatimonadota bacterium]